MKPKKIPQRMCVGCMQMKNKSELLRIVKSADGDVSIDQSGKKNGRGAYICKSSACLAKAIKAKKLDRAFEMNIPDSVYASLEKEMGALE